MAIRTKVLPIPNNCNPRDLNKLISATGQFLTSLKYAAQHKDVYPLAMIYSTVGYLGVQFVLALIKSSGVLITTIGKLL